jgi:hypothetical protein
LEHVLPGTFSLSISGRKGASVSTVESAELMRKLFAAPITEAEFQNARIAFLADHDKVDDADRWLDMDTYKLDTPAREKEKARAASLADVRRAFEQVQKQPFATVVVSSPNTAN